MSRRNSRRRQQAMNARRRERVRLEADFLAAFALLPLAAHRFKEPPPPRMIHGDPDTFPWYRGWGAGPVFRRMDGSAIGPVEVASATHRDGSSMVSWEVVEVRPGEPDVVATLIPESEWRKAPSP